MPNQPITYPQAKEKAEAIPLLVPCLPDRKALSPYLDAIDANRYYSNFGPLVKSLEHRLAKCFQIHTDHPMHVVTVSSATMGLELALMALELPKGSKVVLPALNFVAALTATIRVGLVPVIADIDPDVWIMTPDIAEQAAKQSGAKAVLLLATFGQPLDTIEWANFQSRTGIRIIIDAASAFGSQWLDTANIPVVVSMHATKSLAAGEGGFVVSGNVDMISRIAQLSNFGINLDQGSGLPVGMLSHVGANAKLSEYHAAVAHASLDVWEEQAVIRQSLFKQYKLELEHACGEHLLWQSGIPPTSPVIFNIRLRHATQRNNLERLAGEQGIATRRWYQPLLHQHSPGIGPLHKLPCPNAEEIASCLIGLPFFVSLGQEEIKRVVKLVQFAVI
ncbi:MAG: DegT/DnrJ/EryC1/StrS family aminotransferase [Nitrosomonadales bacterium]|nr:DegT/DnrJ/EryC1/StrS family aminotransferase [Nitrosomonadales bacterium]